MYVYEEVEMSSLTYSFKQQIGRLVTINSFFSH